MWAFPLILWLISLVINVGPSFSYCTTSVSVQDLGCHLHWTCSDVNTTTTTFTVQTQIQGEKWQNVSQCVQISSYSCDLSQVFKENTLYGYKFVRLGLSQEHGTIIWTSSQLCDPLKDLNRSFSPPSLSLSLNEGQLLVEVIFPCAPPAICQEDDDDLSGGYDGDEHDNEDTPTCCPPTSVLSLNTTVTLYNTHDIKDVQTRSEVVEDISWKQQFVGLTPGQKYCAVAHFSSSPLSSLQCVHIPPLENPNLFILALCGVFTALLLIMVFVLRTWWCWCASDLKLPKSLMSLQSEDQEYSVVDEPRQAVLEDEEAIVCLSIISLNDVLATEPHTVYLNMPSLRDIYYPPAILQDRFCDGKNHTDYHSDVETDGLVDSGQYPWPRWSSLPALRTGTVWLLGNVFTPECSGIPLSSVRVAGDQITKMDSDQSFKVLPTVYSGED